MRTDSTGLSPGPLSSRYWTVVMGRGGGEAEKSGETYCAGGRDEMRDEGRLRYDERCVPDLDLDEVVSSGPSLWGPTRESGDDEVSSPRVAWGFGLGPE